MKHGVLKHWHPMIGVDWHIPWTPGTPAPAPAPVPYRTGFVLAGTWLTCKYDKTSYTDADGFTMFKGTDIGPLITHIGPPSLTLPIEIIFSASKSFFGSSRYKTGNDITACSLLMVVNPNLNCGNPRPLPLGFVFALTTHRVDMSLGDILAGFLGMLADFALQSILNKIGNGLGGWISGFVSKKIFQRLFNGALARLLATSYKGAAGEALEFAGLTAGVQAAVALEKFASKMNWLSTGVGTVASFFFGGPMGADIGSKPINGYNRNPDDPFTPGGWLGNQGGSLSESAGQAMGKAIDDYFAEPAVGDFPAADPNAPAMA